MKGKNRYPKTEEHRKKLSETMKGRPSPLRGVEKTEEHKKNLSKALKGRKYKKRNEKNT